MNGTLIARIFDKRFLAIALVSLASLTEAAPTDISTVPLASQTSLDVKPNIMLMIDDSGSMVQEYMPASAGNLTGPGYRSYLCNTIYYNPSNTYVIPTDDSGASLNSSSQTSFTSAYVDGFYSFDGGVSTRINLSNAFRATAAESGQLAYYWSYAGSGTVTPTSSVCSAPLADPVTTTGVCASTATPTTYVSVTNSPPSCGSGYALIWKKVQVTSTSGPGSTDETQNFANWYSYYRQRMMMVKSAIGRAFAPLVAQRRYRVGFLTINPTTYAIPQTYNSSSCSTTNICQFDSTNPWKTKYLEIEDFDASNVAINQPSRWFQTLYAQVPNGGTPLREALSRVGRYFGGKSDLINAGMIDSSHPDPVQYSCQQNFTIMTTDGFWDGNGGKKLDGTTDVGNEDGNLTELDLNGNAISPRPIFDGTATGTSTLTDVSNAYQNVACNYTQTQQRTYQTQRNTTQNLKSTVQNLQSTSQFKQSTYQLQQVTTQNLQSSIQNLKNTSQFLQSTYQLQQVTTQYLKTSAQVVQSTSQYLQNTFQWQKVQTQNLQTSTQTVQTSTQSVQSSVQALQTSSQVVQSTVQNWQTTTYVQTCNAVGGNCVDSTSCTPVPEQVTCSTRSVGPTAVASCTPSSANGVTVTCPTPTTTTNVPVSSCTPQTAAAGNNWITITCSNPTATNYSNRAVQTCTNQTAASGNNWTTISCSYPGATNYSNTPVQLGTCASQTGSSGNNWITITCSNPTATNYTNKAVQTCSPQTASSSNSWITLTCSNPTATNYTNKAVQTCTAQTAASGNNWITLTCNANPTTTTSPVSSCSTQTASSGNNWTGIACNQINTTAQTAVQTCTVGQTVGAAPNYTVTNCTNPTTTNVPVQTCTPQTAASGNSWTTITCSNPTATNFTNQPAASCTPQTATSGNNWTTITCNANPISTVSPVATCTPQTGNAGNNWITIACNQINPTGPTAVQSCTVGTTVGPAPNYIYTVCTNPTTTNVPVQTCTPQTAASGNQWITITCPTPNTTTNVPVQTCTPQTAASGNQWKTITCNANPTTTVSPVASCSNQTASSGNNWTTIACNQINSTAAVPVQSCTVGTTVGPSPNYTVTVCTNPTTTNVPVQTCSPQTASSANSWTTITCPTPVTTTNVPVQTCTASAGTSGNNWVTTTCNTNPTSSTTSVTSCSTQTASSGNNWTGITCSTVNDSGWVNATSCTAASPSSGNNYTTTSCQQVSASGSKTQYQTTTTTTVTSLNNGIAFSTAPGTSSTSGWADLGGSYTCQSPAPTLPSPGRPTGSLPPAPPNGCSAWPCTTVGATVTGGTTNSLADVAQYYYKTDLRPAGATGANGVDVSANDVITGGGSGSEDDRANWQHMTTFTMGLGVSGQLAYDPNYKRVPSTSADFQAIRNGTLGWPNSETATSDPLGLCATNPEYCTWHVDDLWHAAVDGRGQYFSANDPNSVLSSIQSIFYGIGSTLGAGSGASTSTSEPVAGDDFAYVAQHITQDWTGDLQAHLIDLSTGALQTAIAWASNQSSAIALDNVVGAQCDNRTIWLFRPGATNNLTPFTWNTRSCNDTLAPIGTPTTGLNSTEQAYFTGFTMTDWAQNAVMSSAQKTDAQGANLVNFLRGERGMENFVAGDVTKLYRTRKHVLGDIVSSQPKYVRAPAQAFGDPGYLDFQANNATRTPMVYVGANDGMLHAFYAGSSVTDTNGGKEAWAFIPTMSLPNLYILADTGYATNHHYFVDGSPAVGDVYDANKSGCTTTNLANCWRTILVGGMNLGGQGYYALDVTDPANPIGLWEFKCSGCYSYDTSTSSSGDKDANLGYSFGNPIISKLSDGTWVVFVTSGYNNTGGDGQGHLYVLNAVTGKLIYDISTGAGSAASPSGLAKINAWIDNFFADNTTLRVYGGDLLGNVWRFDVNNIIAPAGREAALLAVTKDAAGTAQPISTIPRLSGVGTPSVPYVYIGTGRYLGSTDISSTQTQSIYAIPDTLGSVDTSLSPATVIPALRSTLRKVTLTDSGSGSAITRATSDCTGSSCQPVINGWYADLPESGERVNIDMKLFLGTLAVASNVPSTNSCNVGGYSMITFFDFGTGLAVNNATTSGRFFLNSLAVGLTTFTLPSGGTGTSQSGAGTPGGGQPIALGIGGSGGSSNTEIPTSVPPPQGRRISWRELVQ